MSDYESHIGKLTKTLFTKKFLVKNFLDNYDGNISYILNYKKLSELTEDVINEIFLDELDDYIELNNTIYKRYDEGFDDCGDIFQMKKLKDGTYEYYVKYFNGGCGLNEAIEEAYNKII